jgi:hypothetical protein
MTGEHRARVSGHFEEPDEAALPLLVALGRLVWGTAVLEKTLQLELARVHYERALASGDPEGYGLERTLTETEQLTGGQARSRLEALGLPEDLNARIRSAVARRNAVLHRPLEDAELARAIGTGEGLDKAVGRIEQLAIDCGELGVELERFAGDRLTDMLGMSREEMAQFVAGLDVSTVEDSRMRAQLEAVKASGIDLAPRPVPPTE